MLWETLQTAKGLRGYDDAEIQIAEDDQSHAPSDARFNFLISLSSITMSKRTIKPRHLLPKYRLDSYFAYPSFIGFDFREMAASPPEVFPAAPMTACP